MPGYQHPFPSLLEFPSPGVIADLYKFVSNSLARMLAEFLKGKDRVLHNKDISPMSSVVMHTGHSTHPPYLPNQTAVSHG